MFHLRKKTLYTGCAGFLCAPNRIYRPQPPVMTIGEKHGPSIIFPPHSHYSCPAETATRTQLSTFPYLFNSDWIMHPSCLLLVPMPRSFTIFQLLSPLPLPRLPLGKSGFYPKSLSSSRRKRARGSFRALPSNGPRNGFARIKIITYRAIKTNRNINSWYYLYNMNYTDGYLSCYLVSMIFTLYPFLSRRFL